MGAALARRLLADGHEVHLLLRPGHAAWRVAGLKGRARVHPADLRDAGTVQAAVRAVQPEWIFHLAVHGAYSSQRDPHAMVEANVGGTVNLVEACLEVGFEAFVNAGSSSEYGFKDHPPSETELPEPNSHYAVTKVSATMFCGYTARSRGAAITTLRLYSVYGPWEEPTRLLPTVVAEGLQGRLPPLVGPDVARDFVCIDDVAEAFVLAASGATPGAGAVYNVGSGRQTTIREIVDLARTRFGIEAEPRWGSHAERSWDTTVWVSDPARIGRELGWAPAVPLAEGFERFIAWFEAHPGMLARYEQEIAAGRGTQP